MKKVLVLMLVMAMLAVTSLAFAGGGQNCEKQRGDKGKGEVSRHQKSGNGM